MVRLLFGARPGVSGMQMKRGMGIAAYESKRQQHDEAAQEQESLHEMSTDSGGFEPSRIPDSTRLLEGEGGPHDLCRRRSHPITMAKARPGTTTHCSNGVRPVPSTGRTGIAAVYDQLRRISTLSHSLKTV